MTPRTIRKLLTGLASTATLLLAACGGGGDDDDGGNNVVRPSAVINADQTRVPVGTTVTLDGKASSSPNGGALSYQWELANRPQSSTAALSSATASTTTFTPDQAGQYVTTLVVNDGSANSNNASVTITATNPDPVAIITPAEQAVLLNSEVTLDGSASLPPTDGDASKLVYQWTVASQPDGASLTLLTGADTAQASFTADATGVYQIRLIVQYEDRISSTASAEIRVNTSNSSPVASVKVDSDAERDSAGNLILKATVGQAVTLDGTNSHDPDGDTLHYRWRYAAPGSTKTSKPYIPYASKASITNAEQAIAALVPDSAGDYYIDFSVYDDSVATTQRVVVRASKAAGAANNRPVAVIRLGAAASECELGGPYVWYQICSISSVGSGDADDDALTYRWTYWNTQFPNEKTSAQGSSLSIPSTTAGTYEIELIANDGTEDSAPASHTLTIKTGANSEPLVNVTVDIARIMVGDTAVFDGSNSSDPNSDPISYRWTLTDRPDGSSATLQNTSSAKPTLVTDQPGIYTAELQVSDPKGAIDVPNQYNRASIFAKSKNNPPSAKLYNQNPGGSILTSVTGAPGQAICYECHLNTISGAANLIFYAHLSDPDNDLPLYWLFSNTKRPDGAPVFEGGSGEAKTNATQLLPSRVVAVGDYQFQLIVSDGIANTEQNYDIRIANRANYPSLLLEQVSNDSQGSQTGVQQFFPFHYKPQAVNYGFQQDGVTSIHTSYQLTAVDQDYTIEDLQTSAKEGLTPTFAGLQNNQVIRKGESVTFRLINPAIPDNAAWQLKYNEATSANKAAILAEYRQLVLGYEFTWSFKVKERDGYVFRAGP